LAQAVLAAGVAFARPSPRESQALKQTCFQVAMSKSIMIHRDDIVKEGWIMKESAWLKFWRKRWMVVTSDYVCTYTCPQAVAAAPTDFLRMREAKSVTTADDDDERRFRICTQRGDFRLETENAKEKEEWMSLLGQVLVKAISAQRAKEGNECDDYYD